MATVKLDINALNALNALQLSGKANTLVAALTGNATFPTPEPSLATLTAASTALAEAYALQKQKESESYSATRATEALLVALQAEIRDLGAYVQKTSDGDPAAILSSGFAVEKDREAAKPLPAPEGITASFGDEPGEIDLQWSPLASRSSYEIHIAEGDDAPYRYAAGSTKSRATLEGLVSGTLYHIKIRGMNSAGPGAYSNPITQRAS